jgi:hypothetical protein
VEDTDVHQDLQQLTDWWKLEATDWWKLEAICPLAVTTNIRVVTRAIDADVWETNYYGIINKIIEFNFTGNNKFKVVFFDYDWFDKMHATMQVRNNNTKHP